MNERAVTARMNSTGRKLLIAVLQAGPQSVKPPHLHELPKHELRETIQRVLWGIDGLAKDRMWDAINSVWEHDQFRRGLAAPLDGDAQVTLAQPTSIGAV